MFRNRHKVNQGKGKCGIEKKLAHIQMLRFHLEEGKPSNNGPC